ncbi:ethanolamine ammonia-lyase reactivating factor EutA [Aromatoleum toluclasticum]|uniref:ethanolamine ammonia-lyase reactivating factor EutA n=1 Tax=Aromatoleum toluclasticum TaxID=92003 RepID=UPI0012FBD185|nr:ethanolamine ammonia-lyase reactivating factor EutA [Aromatoleum toluclasticum]
MAEDLRRRRHEAGRAVTGAFNLDRLHDSAGAPALRLHDGDGEHIHELSIGERGAITEFIWKVDNVELTTVGIDIGSSTSHLMFSRVRLQRKTQLLSSQFVVVDRKMLWRSPILLTPFLADETIDAAALGAFIDDCYQQAGVSRADIDSGAVILTGEAIKKRNAQAIAELFAADSGKFVCASAGHHLECVLAAHGSGAVALSREAGATVLNVDIGGGTTKLALIRNGEILSTCAFAVGGRLIAFDTQGRLTRIDEAARIVAHALGIELRLGQCPALQDLDRVVAALADVAVSMLRQRPPAGLARGLLLTEALPGAVAPDMITFSGGVSEYLYGRETAQFGDIARPLAERIGDAFGADRILPPLRDTGQGIRATVIGASQFSMQVSGKTIHLSEVAALPVHNVPVLFPALPADGALPARAVTSAVAAALARAHVEPDAPVAVALKWRGDPHYIRLRHLAEGIAAAIGSASGCEAPLILISDGDIGKTLGHILEHELALARPIVSIDGIQLRELDFVDIGEVIEPSHVVPIMIKSLLFAGGNGAHPADRPNTGARYSIH